MLLELAISNNLIIPPTFTISTDRGRKSRNFPNLSRTFHVLINPDRSTLSSQSSPPAHPTASRGPFPIPFTHPLQPFPPLTVHEYKKPIDCPFNNHHPG